MLPFTTQASNKRFRFYFSSAFILLWAYKTIFCKAKAFISFSCCCCISMYKNWRAFSKEKSTIRSKNVKLNIFSLGKSHFINTFATQPFFFFHYFKTISTAKRNLFKCFYCDRLNKAHTPFLCNIYCYFWFKLISASRSFNCVFIRKSKYRISASNWFFFFVRSSFFCSFDPMALGFLAIKSTTIYLCIRNK